MFFTEEKVNTGLDMEGIQDLITGTEHYQLRLGYGVVVTQVAFPIMFGHSESWQKTGLESYLGFVDSWHIFTLNTKYSQGSLDENPGQ